MSETKEWANVWLSAAITAARSAPKKSLAPAKDALSDDAAADTEMTTVSSDSAAENDENSDKREGASEEDDEASSDVVESGTDKSELTQYRTLVPSNPYPTFLQIANGLCVLMFIYTMYRICYALEQMQTLTRESLVQQQRQQEVFQQILQQLQNQQRRT